MQALLDDPETVEVIVNPDGQVWHERQGTPLQATGTRLSADQVAQLIYTVAGLQGAVCTAEHPSVSAILPGSRVRFQGLIPPATPAPSCVMRRPAHQRYTLTDYVGQGVMTSWQATVIEEAVAAKQNMLLAGQTGSGKTTLLATLLALVQEERLVTIEDTAELPQVTERCHALYTSATRPMATLLRDSLRLRPDRIIVGEVRGVEAVDLLDAWQTGHPGGIATIHAGTPDEALRRLESCVRQVSPSHPQPLPLEVAQPLIAQTVHLLVCLSRTPTGRRVSALARVHGLQGTDYHLERLTEASL
jgi:type IV secretion system protein VirB11